MKITEFKKQLDKMYQKYPTSVIRVDWSGEWSCIPGVAVSSPNKAILIEMGGRAIKDMPLSTLKDTVDALIRVFPEYRIGLDFHGMMCTIGNIEMIEGGPYILSGHMIKAWRGGGSYKYPGTFLNDGGELT